MNKQRKTNDESTDGEPALFQCADLILPYLRPRELAATSSTCKTLNQICNTITSIRSSDASRNLENFPIPFINSSVDRHNPPYSYFIYTKSQLLSPSGFQPWGSPKPRVNSLRLVQIRLSSNSNIRSGRIGGDSKAGSSRLGGDSGGAGCGCERCGEECECRIFDSGVGVMGECGLGCRCGSDCENRVGRKGIAVRLKIVRDKKKGWGLHAAEPIRSGLFVCEYAGELLTTEEARRRQQVYDELSLGGQFSSSLLVVREHLPSGKACLRINIDATRVGNVARFINHSCDGGNLSMVLVRSSGAFLPRLCCFASRDIRENEELSFSYGTVRHKKKGLKCFCGSSCCSGVLPSELT